MATTKKPAAKKTAAKKTTSKLAAKKTTSAKSTTKKAATTKTTAKKTTATKTTTKAAAKTTTKKVEAKAGIILNLGELEYEDSSAGTSGWSLPGHYNDWNTDDTYLYEEGDFYVAKNISGLDKGFKFCHAEFGWKGVGSSEAVAAGKWHKFGGEENIRLADNKAYDIYMTKDGKQFQVVLAGSPVPSAPAVVADFWGIIGVGGDWDNDKKLTEAEAEEQIVNGFLK